MSDKPKVVIYGDGVHDDTVNMQKVMNKQAVAINEDGSPFTPTAGKFIKLTRTINITDRED